MVLELSFLKRLSQLAFKAKRLFSLVIETVEREEESLVISDLVFSVKLQHFRRVAAALGLKKK